MLRVIRWIADACYIAMAALLVLWPVLCCCSFKCSGGHCGGAAQIACDDGHEGDEHGHGSALAEHEHEPAAPCHQGDSDQRNPGRAPSGSCGCSKSATTLARHDVPRALELSVPLLAMSLKIAAWVPEVELSLRRTGPTVARPPPMGSARLRVLRI